MNQQNRLRRKLEKYAIPNLTLYLIICYGIGYLMQFLVPAGYQYLMLDPFLVLKGQVWRLVTWILIPPDSSNIFFVLITLYLYYSLGGLLERIWGTYKYNVYLFSGLLFTILGAFVLCGYSVLMGAQPDDVYRIVSVKQRQCSIFWTVFYLLYQHVHFPGMCGQHPGCAGAADVSFSDQGQMARYRLRHYFAGKLHSGWYRHLDCGDFLAVELPGIFPALERKDASVSGADQAAAGISSEDAVGRADERDYAAQMRGLRQNGAGRRRSGIPFLLQV